MNDTKIIEVLALIEREARNVQDGIELSVFKYDEPELDYERLGFRMATWSESYWDCGTTACFAGWAAVSEGYKLDGPMCVDPVTGTRGYIEYVGARVLGLTDYQREMLFYAYSLAELYERIAGIMGIEVQDLHNIVAEHLLVAAK